MKQDHNKPGKSSSSANISSGSLLCFGLRLSCIPLSGTSIVSPLVSDVPMIFKRREEMVDNNGGYLSKSQ